MKRPLGTLPDIICASVLLMGHICLGQTTTPAAPAQAAPAPAPAGPVVVGEKPASDPAANMDLAFHPDSQNAPTVTKASGSAGAAGSASAVPAKTIPPKDASAAYSSPSKPYVIGSLDVLEIKVWNDANLSGMFAVGPDGLISIPLLGEIRADGLTLQELTRTVHDKLAAAVFTEDSAPEVNIQVVRVNSKKYYVLGGVNRQGEYPLVGTVTILDAFANTGGFHDFAKTTRIYVLRDGKKIPFNYKQAIQGKNMKQNIELQNGDRIVVPE
jgi:polysaccharide export outer membrane protein